MSRYEGSEICIRNVSSITCHVSQLSPIAVRRVKILFKMHVKYFQEFLSNHLFLTLFFFQEIFLEADKLGIV